MPTIQDVVQTTPVPRGLRSATLGMCGFTLLGIVFRPPAMGTLSFLIMYAAITAGSLAVLWYFWCGRKWVRVLVLLTSVLAIVNLASITSATQVQRVVIVAEATFGAWLLYWLNTKDVAAYFRKASEDQTDVVGAGRIVAALLTDPPRGIDGLLLRGQAHVGFAVGILGVCAFPVVSFASRLRSGSAREDELRHMLLGQLPAAVIFFGASCLAVYVMARTLGGRGRLLDYASVSGWAGIFPILWAVLTLPVVIFGPMLSATDSPLGNVGRLAIVLPLMVAFISVVPWIRMHLAIVTRVLGLSRWRSVTAWGIPLGPLFVLYDYLI